MHNLFKNSLILCTIIIYVSLSGCKETPNETINNYYLSTDSLTNPGTPLRVVFTNPSEGLKGPFFAYSASPVITIQFNKLINVARLNSPVSIKWDNESYRFHPLEYHYPYDNENFQNIMILSTSNLKYKANTTYTISIDTSLIDVHGYSLSEPYDFSFLPEPHFRLISGSPDYDNVEPFSTHEISFEFNSNVNENTFNSISVAPSASGKWNYRSYYGENNDSTTAIFRLNDTLLYDTKYTVSIGADARDINGLIINEPYNFTFTTSPVTASFHSSSSTLGAGGFWVFNYISFKFNALIDTSSVRSSIKIVPELKFDLQFSSSNYNEKTGYNVVSLSFDLKQFQKNTTYEITLDKTIRTEKGIYMKKPFTYSISTQ